RMCNYYPAKAIGVDDRLGSIEAGKIANLTVFTNRFEVIGCAVNGEWNAFS
ncbi:amidohydrolase family protein, partial [Xanthomonas citri pv. citri]|nr:amidohydrolase family protein [Xanthomonas citri pv. citri]